MAKPYSDDLRERVVRAVEGGSSRHKAAGQFDVSVSFVVKLMQRFHATGSFQPGDFGGRREPKLAPHEALVHELVARTPSATLLDLQRKLSERGVEVGKSSIARFLQRLRISYKKNALRGRAETSGRSRRARRVAGPAARRAWKPREIVVVLGDPRLPDNVKPDGRYGRDDLRTVQRLRAALGELTDFRFQYADCHAELLPLLGAARPDLVANREQSGRRAARTSGAGEAVTASR